MCMSAMWLWRSSSLEIKCVIQHSTMILYSLIYDRKRNNTKCDCRELLHWCNGIKKAELSKSCSYKKEGLLFPNQVVLIHNNHSLCLIIIICTSTCSYKLRTLHFIGLCMYLFVVLALVELMTWRDTCRRDVDGDTINRSHYYTSIWKAKLTN